MLPRWSFKNTLHKKILSAPLKNTLPAVVSQKAIFLQFLYRTHNTFMADWLSMSYCNRNAKNSSFFSALGSKDQVRKSNESDRLIHVLYSQYVSRYFAKNILYLETLDLLGLQGNKLSTTKLATLAYGYSITYHHRYMMMKYCGLNKNKQTASLNNHRDFYVVRVHDMSFR